MNDNVEEIKAEIINILEKADALEKQLQEHPISDKYVARKFCETASVFLTCANHCGPLT